MGLVLTSCQSDEPFAPGAGEEVQASFTISVPDAMGTRAGEVKNSALGGFTNGAGNLNYTVALLREDGEVMWSSNTPASVNGKSATFNPTVVQGYTYNIVAYATFDAAIEAPAVGSRIPADSGLGAIATLEGINNESEDAYFCNTSILGASSMEAALKRPFGKLRLVAEDYDKLHALGLEVANVKVTYGENVVMNTQFDASTKAFEGTAAEKVYEFANETAYNEEADKNTNGVYTVFVDYLPASETGETMYPFTIEVTYKDGKGTYTRTFSQDIPVKRNYLTTLRGDFFTTEAALTLKVEEMFANEETINLVSVSNASQLQEAIDNAPQGQTTEIILGGDIDLTQPIVFGVPPVNPAPAPTRSEEATAGNFILDLNGKTIENPNGYVIENYSAELTITGNGSLGGKGLGGIRSHGGKLIIEGGNYTCSSNWSTGTYQHILKAVNTEVTINGGTFDAATVGGTNNAMINVSENSVVTINAGTFKNVNVNEVIPQFAPYMFTYEKNGKLIINGGDFYGGWRFNGETATTDIYGGNFTVSYDGQSFHANSTHVLTIYGGAFSLENGGKLNPTNHVADGYKAIENGGKYYVVPNEFDAVATTAEELNNALANGGNVVLLNNINITKIDLTDSVTSDVVIDANGYTITTSDSYGIQVKAGKNITIKNAEIEITKNGDYITYAAGLKIENGDYEGKTIKLENCEIRMANTDWAYAVNMPASVKNLNLELDKCVLEGALAVQCWGDNNTITITNSKLICNYTTSAQYTSYCVALQGDGTYNSDNNTLTIDSCEFLYSGVDNFNSKIRAVYVSKNTEENVVNVSNCAYGEKIVPYVP